MAKRGIDRIILNPLIYQYPIPVWKGMRGQGVIALSARKSKIYLNMKLNMTLGRQTTILGNVALYIGKVSVVVDIGNSSHSITASIVRYTDTAIEATTNTIQNSFSSLVLLVEIWENPPIEEDSRKFLAASILNES